MTFCVSACAERVLFALTDGVDTQIVEKRIFHGELRL